MLKSKIVWSMVILLGTAFPSWGQIRGLARSARQGTREMRIPSRVKGADVAGHFKLNTPGARWAQTYLLNENFRHQLAQETERQLMQYHENDLLLGERPIMHPHSLRARILNPYPGDWDLQRK